MKSHTTETVKDLFGEEIEVQINIDGNPLLASICRQILEITRKRPDLLEGDTVGEIDRKLMIMIWLDNGLRSLLPDIEQRKAITDWMQNTKQCIDPEAISRARRYLQERDKIRLPAKAILNAERHRQRIAKSVKQ